MTCKLTEKDYQPCQGMELSLEGKCYNDPSLGFYVSELMSLSNGTARIAGVAYRHKRGRQGSIYINYCPYCGTPIHQFQPGQKQDSVVKQ